MDVNTLIGCLLWNPKATLSMCVSQKRFSFGLKFKVYGPQVLTFLMLGVRFSPSTSSLCCYCFEHKALQLYRHIAEMNQFWTR